MTLSPALARKVNGALQEEPLGKPFWGNNDSVYVLAATSTILFAPAPAPDPIQFRAAPIVNLGVLGLAAWAHE